MLLIGCSALHAWAGQDSTGPPPPGYAEISPAFNLPASESALQAMRTSGDLSAQRRHFWQVFAALTQFGPDETLPTFLTWYGAGEVFARTPNTPFVASRTVDRSFLLPRSPANASHVASAPPLIIRAHYNLAAYRHIRANGLDRLTAPSDRGGSSGDKPAPDSIPAFPRSAIIVKTVWWPVPAHGAVALPVWDPATNPARPSGNDYPTWARNVAVSAGRCDGAGAVMKNVKFMGRAIPGAQCVAIDRFFHLVLDQRLAAQLMTDPMARSAALMLLGRSIRAGDALVLVGISVATRETVDWVWGTLWWHDAADQGPYATLRPATINNAWRNYLMNVSFDTELPQEPDGMPHIAYNPWLEARLPDSGDGGGVTSNCMSCHRRASVPATAPFLVTRGNALRPGADRDPGSSLRTSSLWSIPLQSAQ